MAALSLMSRAREFLQQRAGVSALVIVPLAMAGRAQADSVFVLGTGDISIPGGLYDNNYISHTNSSGGALGHAYSLLTDGGQNVHFTGDTIVNQPLAYYVTSAMAADSDDGFGNIVFQWVGTFAPGGSSLDTTDYLSLTNLSSAPIFGPNDGAGSVTGSLDAQIYDSSKNLLVDNYVPSLDNGGFLQAFGTPGTPDRWLVTLTVQWTFPTVVDSYGTPTGAQYPGDQLNFNPAIDMSIVPGSGSSTASTPLPAAVWSGGSLLGLVMLGTFVRNLRPRRIV